MNENINPILKEIIDRTEEVSFLPDVRKDAEMNFYLLYTDAEGNIVNIWKEALEGKSHFILNRIRFNGYFRIGIIEKDRPVYVCSDWREALSIHTMQKAAVVLPSSKRSIRKVESILRAKGCIVRKPTIEAQIVAPIDNAPEAMHSIAKPQHIGNHPYPPEIPERESDVSYIGPALLEQFEHDEWHIRNFIPKGPFLGFIFSPSSYGKTFFALHMSFHMAAGFPTWHGFICNRARVLYVAGESIKAIKSRIIAFAERYTDSFISDFCLYPLSVPLTSPDGMWKLRDKIKKLEEGPYHFKPDIIFFDTWNTFFGGEENDAAAVARFRAEVIIRLQIFYDCTIIFLHHSPKTNEKDLRGSGAIKGMADFALNVSKTRENEEQTIRRITIVKNRLGPEGDYVDAAIKTIVIKRLGKDRDGFHIKAAYLEHVGNSIKIPELSGEGRNRLSILRDAITLHGVLICIGVWSISGSDLQDHMRNVCGKDDSWITETFSTGGDYFDELIDKGAICIRRNSNGEIESLTMLSSQDNDIITQNRKLVSMVNN